MVVSKKVILDEMNSLPESVETDDVMERVFLLSKIEKGLYDIESGNTHSHGAVKEKMKKWL